MSDIRKYTTPEAAHLAEQERLLAELTDELANRETEFATTGAEFEGFRIHYLRRFAPLYAELDRLEADIAHRLAEERDTADAQAAAAQAAARADESSEALGAARDSAVGRDADDNPRAAPPPELRDLYREAAKKIHPDLATDVEERARRSKLMVSLNAAYAVGDAEAIARIVNGEAARPEAITGDDVASRLVRVIRKLAQIRDRFEELVRLTEALGADPLFVLFVQCQGTKQVDADPLADDEARLRARIASAQAQMNALVASGAPHHRAAAG